MDGQLLAIAGLGTATFSVVALPWLFTRDRRPWAAWILLVATLDVMATLSPFLLPLPFLSFGHWNWAGKAANLVVMLSLAGWLVRRQVLTRQEIGLQFRSAGSCENSDSSEGSGRALLWVLVPYFLALAALKGFTSDAHDFPSLESLAFEATLPGLAEELAYRGLLMALYDRLLPGGTAFPLTVFGARLGLGAIVVSVGFGVLHGVTFDEQLALQCSPTVVVFTGSVGLVLAWVRARTGSLVLPVAVHNLTNLVLISMPGLR